MVALINGLGGPAGFGTEVPDFVQDLDVSSVFEDGLNFFGREYTSLNISSRNGVSFEEGGLPTTPYQISESTFGPQITPFNIAPRDDRPALPSDGIGTSTGSDKAWYALDTANDRLVVTWDDIVSIDHDSLIDDIEGVEYVQNAYQLILTDQQDGNFDIEFRYELTNPAIVVYFTGGIYSGPPTGGFTAATGEPGTGFDVPGSGEDYDTLGDLDILPGNTGVPGLWQWSVNTGELFPGGVPELPEFAAFIIGDPHLVTIDGVAYDFQAVGEYVALETQDGGEDAFEVQARFVQAGEMASTTEAVAVNLGGVEVMIDASQDQPLWVDGEVLDLDPAASADVMLEDELVGRVFRDGDTGYGVILAGEDGEINDGDTQLRTELFDDRLDFNVWLSDDLAGNVQGLLGDADGNPDNDVALADGTVLERPFDYTELYGEYRYDWRVDSEEESLFTYAEGEGPDTHYDPAHPSDLLSIDQFTDDEIAAAEAVLADTDLTPGSIAYDHALLDFLATGDESFIDSALAAADGLDEVELAGVDAETVAELTDFEPEKGKPTEEDEEDDDDGFGGLELLLLLGLAGGMAYALSAGGLGGF